MRAIYWGLIVLSAGLASSIVAGAAADNGGLRLYSDMCIHPESGDLLGTRIAVFDLGDASYVTFQEAEGVMGKPETVRLAPDDLRGSALSFVLESGGKRERFQGAITEGSIAGKFDDGRAGPTLNPVFQLKRVSKIVKGFAVCR